MAKAKANVKESGKVDPKAEKKRRDSKGNVIATNEGCTDISNFLKSLTEKNYAEANKYLHGVLDTKMKDRIKSTSTN